MASIQPWEVVSFKRYVSDKRKITRKKHAMETDLYPAEGHRTVHAKDGSSQYLYCIGGSRHESESLLESSKDIIKYKFHVETTDMYLSECNILSSQHMHGGQLPALTHPAVCGWVEDSYAKLLVHGGINISGYSPINDVFLLQNKLNDNRNSQCTVHLGYRPDSAMLQHSNVIQGDIPSARYGHVLVHVSHNKFVLFGGSCFAGRSGRRVRLQHIFSTRQAGEEVYLIILTSKFKYVNNVSV